jgi:predicted dehydrogenase
MIVHPPLSVLFVGEDTNPSLKPFFSYLQSMQHIQLSLTSQLHNDLNLYDVVVTTDTTTSVAECEQLTEFVHRGGGWVGLIHSSDKRIPHVFGAELSPVGPVTELRVLFENRNHPMAKRLPDAMYLKGPCQCFDRIADDVETVLYADWHYRHRPVLVNRPVGDGYAACTTLQAYGNPVFQQILYRLLRLSAGQSAGNGTLGVGLLGYATSVGKTHGLGVQTTSGLTLHAGCDVSPERLKQAHVDFPGIRTLATVDTLIEDPQVELVIIATPPNNHAALSLQLMTAGKHVVCEKPLALNTRETDTMVEMAEKQGVHLSCYQNRRWDVDYLAINQALADGMIGDLFYMETFVGGFEHPCGYWHSHDAISGGTAYDWGGHYLDWIVGLIPDRITAIVGTRQNRVWRDVTNADQERIQIRFAGGQEAEFMHSTIAGVRKPKWYLLGTEGAIVGHWKDVTEHEIDPLLYFQQHDIPATEMPPDLTLYRRHHSGQIVSQKLPIPRREHHLFYRNLADHLLTGEPLAAPLGDSVRVVAILEAAARSASKGGTIEVLDG